MVRAHCIALTACCLLACGAEQVGAGCSATEPCAGTLVCSETETPGTTVCMSPCEAEDGGELDGNGSDVGGADAGGPPRLCGDGTVCRGEEGGRFCYLGGRTPFTTTCMSDLECEAGTVCSPDLHLCEQACLPRGNSEPCAAGEFCVDVADGVCRRERRARCSEGHPCAGDARCSSDLLRCEPPCTVGSEACGTGFVCADVGDEGGDGVCRGGPQAKCSELYPCGPNLACTYNDDAGTPVCVTAM